LKNFGFFFLNSKFQVVGQKFPNSIGNSQGNNPEMTLLCPQISSNASFFVHCKARLFDFEPS